MRFLLRAMLIVTFLSAQVPLVSVFADSEVGVTLVSADTVEAYLQVSTQAIRTTDQLAYVLAAGHASVEDIHALVDPIAKRSTKLPLVGLRDREFYFNAQPTGVRVSSFQPFVLTYQKQTWTYDPHLGAAENHKKFMGLFATKQASSLLFSKVVGEAVASETAPEHYGKAGMIAGAFKGSAGGAILGVIILGGIAVAGTVTAPVVLVVLGAGLVAGAVTGGYVGHRNGKAHGKDQEKSVDRLLTSKDILKIECNQDRVQLSTQTEGRSVAVRFERIPPAEMSVWQPIIDKAQKMWYGSTPKKNADQMKYYVATRFGSNPAEVDVGNGPQGDNSSFEKAFFTEKQGMALHIIESCKRTDDFVKDCLQKNSGAQNCVAPNINVPQDEYRREAAKMAACMNENTDRMIRGQMMCIPGYQILSAYKNWKDAPAPAGAKSTGSTAK